MKLIGNTKEGIKQIIEFLALGFALKDPESAGIPKYWSLSLSDTSSPP
jgi:hypothetical protein